METNARLTRLASCAGCGAKVGAGTLASLLGDFKTRTDPNLIVGFDKSDDASVYVVNEETALIQTVDFFPPIVDDPYLFGQIAAHTIRGSEPLYGLAVTGFARPDRIRRNDGALPGDALVLTKPLGVGILTTAAKAGMADAATMDRLYRQMATLNRDACREMQRFRVHGCTDVTGFGLMGHSCEMAQSSGCTLHIQAGKVPFHPEALELADMGLVPAGAYRNRDFAEGATRVRGGVSRAMQDILYDPQTSGGLLIAVDEADAEALQKAIPGAAVIGYVTEREENALVVESSGK